MPVKVIFSWYTILELLKREKHYRVRVYVYDIKNQIMHNVDLTMLCHSIIHKFFLLL